MSFIPCPLDRFHFGAWRDLFEDLFDINFHGIGHKTIVAENDPQRLESGQFLNQILVHTGIEAGDQSVFIDKEHSLALDGLFADGQRQINTPVKKNLEKQVFGRAIRFNVVGEDFELILI